MINPFKSKKGLGRGLSSLIGDSDIKNSSNKKKNIIKIRFISRSYLKSQVRSMVGCLKYLSEKKWSLQKFEKIFKSCNRESCAPLAPPHGLYLEKITY